MVACCYISSSSSAFSLSNTFWNSDIIDRSLSEPQMQKPHKLSNQVFHYTCCNMLKRVMSWRGPSPRHCARATQLLSKKCRSGGKPLATLCPIWSARHLNLRPPAPETTALPCDQLASRFQKLVSSTVHFFGKTKILNFVSILYD